MCQGREPVFQLELPLLLESGRSIILFDSRHDGVATARGDRFREQTEAND